MAIVISDYGWTFCEKCRASRTHGLGYEYETRRKMRICSTCGHTTERKPKVYKKCVEVNREND